MLRVGVVSFLNARPLIDGLETDRDLQLLFDVPSRLADRLASGELDVALVPVIDVLRSEGRLVRVSDACIGCDGETMTVRVFSQIPPHRMARLWCDPDSHTSIELARVLWREVYGVELSLEPLRREQPLDGLEAVLLIGDKVVDPRRAGFAYEVDLGGAWRSHTGLPFVFAVWAVRGRERGTGNGDRVAAASCRQPAIAASLGPRRSPSATGPAQAGRWSWRSAT
jgi:chorismate dehydratase